MNEKNKGTEDVISSDSQLVYSMQWNRNRYCRGVGNGIVVEMGITDIVVEWELQILQGMGKRYCSGVGIKINCSEWEIINRYCNI